MKKLSLTLTGVLLASSALIAPAHAIAQTDPAAAPVSGAQDAPSEPQDVGEIVVLGRYIPEPNRETAEVASFLTSEDLERTGDSNAAAALTRVTGLSIVEGRFIYVRGLGERYSSALLNGSPLPSPEPLQRVVPLDLFPSSILESVTVQKSYSADFPGEFGGGVIDLRTIDAPREPFFNFQASVGGNTETSGKDNLIYFGSRTDFLGFDDDTREVPGLIQLAFDQGQQINGANFDDETLQDMGQSLVNAPLRLIQRQTTPANFGLSAAGGTTVDTEIGEFGVFATASYDNSWSGRDGVQQEAQFSGDDLVLRNDYNVVSNQNDVQLSLMGGLSWSNVDHEVKWTNFYVRSTTKEARIKEGQDFITTQDYRTDYTEWFVRQLFTTQLAGEHDFLDGALEFDWRAAYAKTSRDAPYESRFSYSKDAVGEYRHEIQDDQISFSELDDDVVSGGADVKYHLPLSDAREAIFSAGVASMENNRSAERHDLLFFAPNGLTDSQIHSRVDYLFSDYNINPNTLVLQEIGGRNGAGAYDADLKVNAVYAMVDAEIIPLIRTAVGVRFEDGKQSVTPRDLFGDGTTFTSTEINEEYVLPSATATWNFAEDQQVRLGASMTIGRPQFRELAPQAYTDTETDRTFIGNPYLVDTEITNIDARYEWYFANQQFVTAGVFYKDLTKPVESIIIQVGDQKQQSYLNAPSATIMGAEFEVKKYFEFPDLTTPFLANKRWLVQANYTYSNSEIKVGGDDRVRTINGGGVDEAATPYLIDGSRLQGQSDHVANAQLGWEDDAARSQATLIVNYVSERVTARGAGLGAGREPDYVQEPGVFLDFVYRKDFTVRGGREMGLGIELRNLLGTDFDEHQELGNTIRVNNYDLGQSASISLTARF
jgi:TonB-dependent receptor